MAFGLFGKKNEADLFIQNARILTCDPEFPQGEAMAVKDGKILAVGASSDMEEFIGKHTEVLDLEGKYVLPGFVQASGTPVLDAFKEHIVFLTPEMDLDEVLEAVSTGLADSSGEEPFFAYGYATDLLTDLNAVESASLLDHVENTRPVLLLSRDGYGAWLNSAALAVAKDALEEEAMEILTLPFTLSVLNPFPYDKIQKSVVLQAWNFASQGITTVYNSGSPDTFDNLYQNILSAMEQEDLLPQRHFGSLSIMTPVDPAYVVMKLVQNRTKCLEMDDILNFEALHLFIDAQTPELFQENYLREVCESAMERGFDIHVSVEGKQPLLATLEILLKSRAPAGKEKTITVFHQESLSEDQQQTYFGSGVLFEATPGGSDGTPEGRTCEPAEKLALLDRVGSLETGKYADFVVFEEDPFQGEKMPAALMTFLGGQLVFDLDEDQPDEWTTLMLTQQSFEEEPEIE